MLFVVWRGRLDERELAVHGRRSVAAERRSRAADHCGRHETSVISLISQTVDNSLLTQQQQDNNYAKY